jgi:ABC-type transporter Mla MlaB component
VTNTADHETIVLTGNLLLNELSGKKFPDISHYKKIKTINLQQLINTDSAGLAYLAQIKSHYSDLRFTGVSEKTLVLANLYGLSFIFKS